MKQFFLLLILSTTFSFANIQKDSISRQELKIIQLEGEIEHLKLLIIEKEKESYLIYEKVDSRITYLIWAIGIIFTIFGATVTFLGRDVIAKYFDNQAKELTKNKIESIITEKWLRSEVETKANEPLQNVIHNLRNQFEVISNQMIDEEKLKFQKEAKKAIYQLKENLREKREELDNLEIAEKKTENLSEKEKQKIEEFEETLEAIQEEEKDFELSEKDWFWKGRNEYTNGNLEEAIKSFEKVNEIDSKNENALNWLGVIHLDLEKYEKGLSYLDEAIGINPKNDVFWENRGVAKTNLKKYEEAINDFEESIRINEKNDDAWIKKGNVKVKLGKHSEAVNDFERALELNPKNNIAWNNLGYTKIDLKKYKEAIKDFNQAIKLNPKDDSAFNNRGVAKNHIGKYNEAVLDLEKSISLSPYANAYAHLAFSNIMLDNISEAIQNNNKALELDSDYPKIYFNSGIINHKQGKKNEACKAWEKALELGFEEAKEKLDAFCKEEEE